MRAFILFFCALVSLNAEPKIDNVLVRMIPAGATALIGARMDQIKATVFYKKLLEAQKLPSVDQFAEESGFDPRRDVRELLYATTPAGKVLVARGSFHINESLPEKSGVKKIRHGEYTIWGEENGFCILDSTLAAAGEVPAIEAALDEWKSGSRTGAQPTAQPTIQPLLDRIRQVDPQSQIWGISIGPADFLAENIPKMGTSVDFSKIFRGLDNTWFEADLARGLRADIHGTTARDQDAANLRDAVKGLVGLGRLAVPQNQPDLLRLWDGITVDQTGRAIAIHADIEQNLIDKLVEMLGQASSPGFGAQRPRAPDSAPRRQL